MFEYAPSPEVKQAADLMNEGHGYSIAVRCKKKTPDTFLNSAKEVWTSSFVVAEIMKLKPLLS